MRSESIDRRAALPAIDADGPDVPHAWYGWGSPVGLGVGLVAVGGFFVLVALGLLILSSVG